MLKAKLSGVDQRVAMDELADLMNKDSEFRGTSPEGSEDDSDDENPEDGEKADRFDDTADFYQSDDERSDGDSSPEFGSVGRWGSYNESVGKNFVKWALMG